VRDRVAKLLTRLVMWQFQPANRWARQKLRIDRQRRKIFDLLDDSPSLRARLPEFISNEWAFACYMAGLKTGVGEERLGMPPECPWRVDQVLGADFYPGAPTRA